MASMAKRKRTLMLVVGTVLVVVFFAVLMFFSRLGPQTTVNIGGIPLALSSFSGVLNTLIAAVCIFLECVDYRRGSVIAITALSVTLLSSAMAAVRSRSFYPLPGIITIAIMLVVVLILRRHFAKREKDSTTDQLTGLYNRKGMISAVDEFGNNQEFCFVYLDIDDFKYINDNLGHSCGDMVLKTLAGRIREFAGSKSVIARISGDEFVLTLPKNDSAQANAEKLLDIIGQKITVNGSSKAVECYVTACVGICFYPEDGQDVESLMKCADIAMYEAKNRGKNNAVLYDRSLKERLKRFSDVEALIVESLKNDYFYLVYQPQYYCADKKLRGFETLIRLKTPDGQFVSPGEFIPVAEKTDLIIDIDRYVLKRAMTEFADIVKQSGNAYTISVNVSAKNICSRGFAEMVLSATEETGFPCECLEIEITEYCLAQSLEIAVDNITKLKARGVEIALDDFGTGYASLSYLSKLSIDLLKIDKSFIDEIGKDRKSDNFVNAVVSIGHINDCKVISEGVEHENQLALLKSNGCDYIQGYIWGKPLPYEEAVELVKQSA